MIPGAEFATAGLGFDILLIRSDQIKILTLMSYLASYSKIIIIDYFLKAVYEEEEEDEDMDDTTG